MLKLEDIERLGTDCEPRFLRAAWSSVTPYRMVLSHGSAVLNVESNVKEIPGAMRVNEDRRIPMENAIQQAALGSRPYVCDAHVFLNWVGEYEAPTPAQPCTCEKCDGCDGDGEMECPTCGSDSECQRCRGHGRVFAISAELKSGKSFKRYKPCDISECTRGYIPAKEAPKRPALLPVSCVHESWTYDRNLIAQYLRVLTFSPGEKVFAGLAKDVQGAMNLNGMDSLVLTSDRQKFILVVLPMRGNVSKELAENSPMRLAA